MSTNPCLSQVKDHPWVSPSPALPDNPQTPVAPEKSPRQGATGPQATQETAVIVNGNFLLQIQVGSRVGRRPQGRETSVSDPQRALTDPVLPY